MQTEIVKINGSKLLLRNWIIEKPKANILLVHGLGEHSGRYEETAQVLNQAGFSVYSFDRRGEGASEGSRTYIRRMEDQTADLDAVRERMPLDGVKRILMAHSLGGLISVRYMIDYQPEDFSAMVLSGPLLETDDDMAPMLKKIAGLVGTLFPKLPTIKVDSALVSRDKEEVEKYDNDPLVFHGATKASTGYEVLKSIKFVQSKFDEIKLPFIVMHGGGDKLSNPRGSKLLYENASSEDKAIKIFDGWYHEIMREPEKQEFFDLLTQWLKVRF